MKHEEENRGRKVKYLLLGLLFVFYPFIAINYISYLDYPAIITGWALLLTGIVLVLFFVADVKENIVIRTLPIIGFILMIADSFLIFSLFYPNALTDEIIIQTYAAKILIEGKDPYINSNMYGAFKYIIPNPLYVTPGLNGKLVEILLYPGMSVLAFVPVALFNLPDYTTLLIFSFLNLIVIYKYLKDRKMVNVLPYFSVVLLLTIYTFGLSLGGSTDIIWIFFMVLAYVFRKKPWIAGIFYGLSLSSKQLSIIVLPFFLYMIFREKNRSLKAVIVFILTSAASFIISNLPFIIMQPHDWLRNILEAEFQPVFGIGIGFSEIAFSGLVSIPSSVFTLLFLSATIILFLFYIKYFGKLKYALFVFPMIIFLFNYRLLLGYVLDWALLIVLAYADYINDQKKVAITLDNLKPAPLKNLNLKSAIRTYWRKNSRFTSIIFVILILTAGGSVYLDSHTNDPNIYTVVSVSHISDSACIPGYISSMNVTLKYEPAEGMKLTSPVYFRIITSDSTGGNYNGLLWYSNKLLHTGYNNVTAYPESYADLIRQGISFNLAAYYEEKSNVITGLNSPVIDNYGLANYALNYPTNEITTPYVFWKVEKTNLLNKFTYVPINGKNVSGNGFNMSVNNKASTNGLNLISMESSHSQDMNITYLASEHKTIRYNYTYSGGGSYYNGTNMTQFDGVQITIDDTYNFFIGINSSLSQSTERSYGTNYYMINPRGVINFSQIVSIAKETFNLKGNMISTFAYVLSGTSHFQGYFQVDDVTMTSN